MEQYLLLKAFVLGIVEGITEFLPISSTGHLILAGHLIGFDDSTFEVFIQLGAILAVVAIYWQDLWQRLTHAGQPGPGRRVVVNVCVAFLPAAVIGAVAHHAIKTYLFRPITVALALIVGGVGILIVERFVRTARTRSLDTMSAQQSLGVGFAQVIAMWPGFSRAAASIMGGMIAGLDRTTATIFSFYLAIPTMFGATVLDLYKSRHDLHNHGIGITYTVGFVTSFIVAWIAVKGLLRYISRHNFNAFGVYRIILGTLLLILIATKHF